MLPSTNLGNKESDVSSANKRKTRKRTYRFRPEWESQYGLKVKERDPMTQEVTLVECRFCVTFGREERDPSNRKRRKTQSIKLWSTNFRSDQIRQHMLLNHPDKFEEYSRLSLYHKNIFFSQRSAMTKPVESTGLVLPNFQELAMLPSSDIVMNKNQCYVLGIAGGTGSGKTTIADRLVLTVGADNVTHLSYDSYYKDLSHLTIAQRDETNFDHPDALETDLFIRHLKSLKAGRSVQVPLYDFTTHTRKRETVCLKARSILIVEGILLFHDANVREVLDAMVFIDTQNDIRFIRRMNRDIEQRGRSVHKITKRYLSSVRPMHMQFVQPTKQYADLILPGGSNLDVAVDILSVKLQLCLKGESSTEITNTNEIEYVGNEKLLE